MTDYVLFLPEPLNSAFTMIPGAAGATAEEGGSAISPLGAAVLNAAATVQLSESAGVERISADAQSYLERIESTVDGPVAAAAGEAIADSDVQPDNRADVHVFGAIGAISVQGLTRDEFERLRDAGFKIFRNTRVYLPPRRRLAAGASTAIEENWPLIRCGIDQMHAAGFTGRGKRIGILDTGIDASHPEFSGKSIEFAEFDDNGALISTAARDSGEHGTHVSAIATGNSLGVAKDADLAVAAVLTKKNARGQNYGMLAQIVAGFNWLAGTAANGIAASSDIDVINASLGATGYDDYLRSAVENARALGIPFVAAIGNSGRLGKDRHGSPGNYSISVGVGATDYSNVVADFSDWGTVAQQGGIAKPDICAPGAAIRSALPGGTYGLMSGTSMAAPCVAGAVALILQQQPTLSNVSDLEAALYNKVIPVSGGTGRRGGRGMLKLM